MKLEGGGGKGGEETTSPVTAHPRHLNDLSENDGREAQFELCKGTNPPKHACPITRTCWNCVMARTISLTSAYSTARSHLRGRGGGRLTARKRIILLGKWFKDKGGRPVRPSAVHGVNSPPHLASRSFLLRAMTLVKQ